jgi:hypothetical protein
MAVETPQPTVERDKKGRPLPPPGIAPTSYKMALVVPLVAVVLLVIVILINVLDAPGPQQKTVIPKLTGNTGLTVSPVNPFVPLVAAGEPPADILNAVVVPDPAISLGSIPVGGEPTSFDAAFKYSSTASQGALYSFFHQEISGHGWKIFSIGPPTGSKGIEILAQKAGSDGWYWEEGVVIHPTSFGANGVQTTTFQVRLYQASADA